MDTIIFALIFLTFLAMRLRSRWLTMLFFFASLATMIWLFHLHASDPLDLEF